MEWRKRQKNRETRVQLNDNPNKKIFKKIFIEDKRTLNKIVFIYTS